MNLFLTACDWIAFISGIIGAPLGWIEYFHPQIADRWENAIDNSQHKFEELGDRLTRTRVYEILFILAFLSFLACTYFLFSYLSPAIDYPNPPIWLIGLLLLIILPVAAGLFMNLLSWSVDMLNKATDGHAIGTIGLILIIVGLFGDTADKLLSAIFLD